MPGNKIKPEKSDFDWEEIKACWKEFRETIIKRDKISGSCDDLKEISLMHDKFLKEYYPLYYR